MSNIVNFYPCREWFPYVLVVVSSRGGEGAAAAMLDIRWSASDCVHGNAWYVLQRSYLSASLWVICSSPAMALFLLVKMMWANVQGLIFTEPTEAVLF